jgi:E3 ubiquitin-protein ligase TRIP12
MVDLILVTLQPGGRDIAVTMENVDEYIQGVLDAILGKGSQAQAKAFREGFSKVFPITDLQAFSADELVMLFGNSDEDWSAESRNSLSLFLHVHSLTISPPALVEVLKADHGFNVESRAIRDLVEVMSNYDPSMRRAFLQFITGSPKLPIGGMYHAPHIHMTFTRISGFRGLNPLLTVVRKPHEAPLTADDYLPSVMTCVNYLKLPEYSSKGVMREKLRIAIEEGVGSFHLS